MWCSAVGVIVTLTLSLARGTAVTAAQPAGESAPDRLAQSWLSPP